MLIVLLDKLDMFTKVIYGVITSNRYCVLYGLHYAKELHNED